MATLDKVAFLLARTQFGLISRLRRTNKATRLALNTMADNLGVYWSIKRKGTRRLPNGKLHDTITKRMSDHTAAVRYVLGRPERWYAVYDNGGIAAGLFKDGSSYYTTDRASNVEFRRPVAAADTSAVIIWAIDERGHYLNCVIEPSDLHPPGYVRYSACIRDASYVILAKCEDPMSLVNPDVALNWFVENDCVLYDGKSLSSQLNGRTWGHFMCGSTNDKTRMRCVFPDV